MSREEFRRPPLPSLFLMCCPDQSNDLMCVEMPVHMQVHLPAGHPNESVHSHRLRCVSAQLLSFVLKSLHSLTRACCDLTWSTIYLLLRC